MSAACLALGLGVLAQIPLLAQDKPRVVADSSRGLRVQEAVEEAEKLGFRGAVLVADRGKVLFAGGVGAAAPGEAELNTANTRFEIASLSKQFTAAAVLVLVDKRRLTLDTPVAKVLKGVPESCAGITIQHLLQHTSGIPGTNSQGGGEDLEEVLPLFFEGGPQHEPGTHWEYWNQGYALLTAVVEARAKMPFTDFSRRYVFQKAKLKHTGFTGDKPGKGEHIAVGLASRGEPRSALDHPYGSFGFQYRGMGGVVTNVWDLWRWDRALASHKVLKKPTSKALLTPGPGDYGLGWFIRKPGGITVQNHTGSVRGFLADMRRYPDRDGCIIILCNDDSAPLHEVSRLMERALLSS